MDGAVWLASWQAAAGCLAGGGGIRLRLRFFPVCFVFNIFSDFFRGTFFQLLSAFIDYRCLLSVC